MQKKNNFIIDEFFILGAVLFVCFLLVFCYRVKTPLSAYHLSKAQTLAPRQPTQSANEVVSNVSQRPQMLLVDTQETSAIPDDDVINYTSSFYSFTLPYDLDYFTNKYGSYEGSRQLLLAHKQLYDQLIQNKYIYNPIQSDPYSKMISTIEEMIKIEKELYNSIQQADCPEKKKIASKLNSKVQKITPPHGKIILRIKKYESRLVNNISGKNSAPAHEAVIIITSINDHLVLLANKASANYNRVVMNKKYNYKEFKKPVLLNIVNNLNDSLN